MALVPSLLIGLAALVPASSDVYFEQTTVTSTDGAPAGPGVVSRVWYSGRKMRMEAGDVRSGPAFILRLDTRKAYRLDPAQKVAIEIDLGRLRARAQMDLSMAGDLMGADGAARVTPLETRKRIAGYECRGYTVASGSTTLEIFMAAGIPLRVDAFADFLEWSGANDAMGALLSEVRKLPGFPLETRSRVTVLGQVHETLSTVNKVRLGKQSAHLFAPPADYTIVGEPPER